ncbi:MAG: hypothetical protein IPK15_12535 [Verrucomicrobia bacterium]|nr:hypothetical protein [Verrucomicrobiota bacterium]
MATTHAIERMHDPNRPVRSTIPERDILFMRLMLGEFRTPYPLAMANNDFMTASPARLLAALA